MGTVFPLQRGLSFGGCRGLPQATCVSAAASLCSGADVPTETPDSGGQSEQCMWPLDHKTGDGEQHGAREGLDYG